MMVFKLHRLYIIVIVLLILILSVLYTHRINKYKNINDRILKMNSYCYENNMDSFYIEWNRLYIDKDNVIKFIIYKYSDCTSIGTWIWKNRDTVYKNTNSITNIPNLRTCALYLVNSLYYNNYFFAKDRIVYDNSKLYVDSIGVYKKTHPTNLSYKNNINNYYMYIDKMYLNKYELDSLWIMTNKWYNNGMKGRPFKGSSFYWVGEPGGQLSKEYLYNNKIITTENDTF